MKKTIILCNQINTSRKFKFIRHKYTERLTRESIPVLNCIMSYKYINWTCIWPRKLKDTFYHCKLCCLEFNINIRIDSTLCKCFCALTLKFFIVTDFDLCIELKKIILTCWITFYELTREFSISKNLLIGIIDVLNVHCNFFSRPVDNEQKYLQKCSDDTGAYIESQVEII